MFSLFRQLLNVIARTGVIGQFEHSRKPIQTIAHSYVNSLSEYLVSVLRIGYNLSIPTTHVQDDRFVCTWKWFDSSIEENLRFCIA